MAQKRALDIIRSGVLTIASIIGGACIVLVLVGIMFGLRPLVVVSGSMEPAIPTGSLILIQQKPAEELRIGDIVTVSRPDGEDFITHRIVQKTPVESGEGVELVLKGDANQSQDPQPYPVDSAERVVLTIPFAGILVTYLQSPFGVVAGILLVLAVVSLYTIKPERTTAAESGVGAEPERGSEPAPDTPTPAPSGATQGGLVPIGRVIDGELWVPVSVLGAPTKGGARAEVASQPAPRAARGGAVE